MSLTEIRLLLAALNTRLVSSTVVAVDGSEFTGLSFTAVTVRDTVVTAEVATPSEARYVNESEPLKLAVGV